MLLCSRRGIHAVAIFTGKQNFIKSIPCQCFISIPPETAFSESVEIKKWNFGLNKCEHNRTLLTHPKWKR